MPNRAPRDVPPRAPMTNRLLTQSQAVFHLGRKSLIRGTGLTLLALGSCFCLSGFPNLRPAPWLALSLVALLWAMWETIRCMRRKWNFYHGAVVLMVYTELMVLILVLYFLLWPYYEAS